MTIFISPSPRPGPHENTIPGVRQAGAGGQASATGLPCPTRTRSTSPTPRPPGCPAPRRGSLHVSRPLARAEGFPRPAPRVPRAPGDARAAGGDARHRGREPRLPARAAPDGPGRPARNRLAQRVWRSGPRSHRAVHLLRRGAALGLPAALPHARHRRPHPDALRQRRAAARVPAQDPARRDALCDRLLRGGSRHRSRGPDHQGSATATTG